MTKIILESPLANSQERTFNELEIGDVFKFIDYDTYTCNCHCIKVSYDSAFVIKPGDKKCLVVVETNQKRPVYEAVAITFKVQY